MILQLLFRKTERKNLQFLWLLKYSNYLNITNSKNTPSDTHLFCFKTTLARINAKSVAVFLKLKLCFYVGRFPRGTKIKPSLIILQHPRVDLSRLYMLFNFGISP